MMAAYVPMSTPMSSRSVRETDVTSETARKKILAPAVWRRSVGRHRSWRLRGPASPWQRTYFAFALCHTDSTGI
eukprot:5268795-Prymnesium_polylepis.1